MKETIYTIPINEAFDIECNCAICAIENRIEKEEIEYTLGPAMMEPDFRIISNKKGFCKIHYRTRYRTFREYLQFPCVWIVWKIRRLVYYFYF